MTEEEMYGRIKLANDCRKEVEAELKQAEAEIAKLKAHVWVLRDERLRTYDGLAQKADKADEYRAALEKITNYPQHDTVYVADHILEIAREALKD